MRFYEVIDGTGIVVETINEVVTIYIKMGFKNNIKFKVIDDVEYYNLMKKSFISKAAAECYALYKSTRGEFSFRKYNTVIEPNTGNKWTVCYNTGNSRINIIKAYREAI